LTGQVKQKPVFTAGSAEVCRDLLFASPQAKQIIKKDFPLRISALSAVKSF
jgi:hypothetical protein